MLTESFDFFFSPPALLFVLSAYSMPAVFSMEVILFIHTADMITAMLALRINTALQPNSLIISGEMR